MEKGEKYLTIMLVGHNKITAFPNEKKGENDPDYKGNGVAVWLNEKK